MADITTDVLIIGGGGREQKQQNSYHPFFQNCHQGRFAFAAFSRAWINDSFTSASSSA